MGSVVCNVVVIWFTDDMPLVASTKKGWRRVWMF